MGYIGPSPNPGQNREVDDISSGFNGSEVNFTLQVSSQNVSPGSSNAIIVSLGGVVQNPGTDYTVAASTLTFTTAPASGLAFFGLVLGQQVDTSDANFSNPVITGDLSIEDKIVHTGDTNTAIRFPAADTVTAETAGSERARIDSSGRLLLGTNTSRAAGGNTHKLFQIESTDATSGLSLTRNSATTTSSIISFAKSRGTSNGSNTVIQDDDELGRIKFSGADGTDLLSEAARIQSFVDGTPGSNDMPGRLTFSTTADGAASPTERMRIDSSGNISIGTTTTSVAKLTIQNMVNSRVHFRPIGDIQASVAGAGLGLDILNDGGDTVMDLAMRGATTYFRNASGETMRIDSSGDIGVGTTSPNRTIEIKKSSPGIRLEETSSGGSKRLEFFLDGSEANIAAAQSSQTIMFSVSGADTMRLGRSGSHAEMFLNTTSLLNNGVLSIATNGSNGIGIRTGATNSQTHMSFQSPNGVHGTISTDGSNTQYNTSSDYRLKENVTTISDGITRIKNLLPKRFNFILKPDVTQDGFLAHEVSSVVPEAVSGDKDAVDSNGDVVSQQFDSSKLVPLLVAAVQELITKVETLEAA